MSHVTLERRAGIAHLTLRRETRSNALTLELLEDLLAALDQLDSPQAVVLAGAGRHFSSGGDVARFAREVERGNGPEYARQTVEALNRAILRLAGLDCPVIARVQGAVTGGALGLMLAADLVVMTPDAFLQPWYAVVGFGPDGGWTRMLADRIGAHRVRALHLLNQRIEATEALSLGLVQAVDPRPDTVVQRWLDTLSYHDAGSLQVSKRLLRDDPSATLDAERDAFVARIDRPEVRAGMARFLDSRSR